MSGNDFDRTVAEATRYCADALEFAERLAHNPVDADAVFGLVRLAVGRRSALHVVMLYATILSEAAPELAAARGCDVDDVVAGWRRKSASTLDAAEAIARDVLGGPS